MHHFSSSPRARLEAPGRRFEGEVVGGRQTNLVFFSGRGAREIGCCRVTGPTLLSFEFGKRTIAFFPPFWPRREPLVENPEREGRCPFQSFVL